MPETLLIHYSSAQQPVSWLLLNEKGAISCAPQQAQINELKSHSSGRKVVLLFNSAYLTVESADIPGNNRNRQLQAVPYALEDKLASDIDEMHFALGTKQDDRNLPVIVINQSQLEACLLALQEADIVADKILADVLCLPFTDNTISILIQHDSVLIKTSTNRGFYCDRINLVHVLPSLITDKINDLNIIHHKSDAALNDEFSEYELNINKHSYNESALEIFAANVNQADQINLLQGRYAPQRAQSIFWQHWKSVAALVGVWIILQLTNAQIESHQLVEKNLQLTAKIERVFKKANPGTRKYNNMRKRMERRLKALQSGGRDNNDEVFLKLLADTAHVLSQQKQLNILAMVYRNQHIDIELSADSLQTLETVKNQLSQQINIKSVLSTSVEKGKVSGRLRVEQQG